MVPRPATEALVDAAVKLLGDRPARVADVGTGSGAIAVALALGALRARIWATDVSQAAIELACANIARHGLTDRITVCRGDLLEGVPGDLDLIVANLPYLPERLRPNVRSSPLSLSAQCLRPATGSGTTAGCSPQRRSLSGRRERC
jgi:release factor glutamine methyltransferase